MPKFEFELSEQELDRIKTKILTEISYSVEVTSLQIVEVIKAKLNDHYYTLQKTFNDYVASNVIVSKKADKFDKLEKKIDDLDKKINSLFFNDLEA